MPEIPGRCWIGIAPKAKTSGAGIGFCLRIQGMIRSRLVFLIRLVMPGKASTDLGKIDVLSTSDGLAKLR